MRDINGVLEELRSSGRKLILHRCSFCGYPCGYQFRGDQLYYDSGCDCVYEGYRPRPESDLVDCLEKNPHLAS